MDWKKQLTAISDAAKKAAKKMSFESYRDRCDYLLACRALTEIVDVDDSLKACIRPVVVPHEMLAGERDVISVRTPKNGDEYIEFRRDYGGGFIVEMTVVESMRDMDDCEGVRVIVSKMSSPFEIGKYYYTHRREVAGPLIACDTSPYAFACEITGRMYMANGQTRNDGIETPDDLIHDRPLVVWRPPGKMPRGKYEINDQCMWLDDDADSPFEYVKITIEEAIAEFGEYQKPEMNGVYLVPGEGRLAVRIGEGLCWHSS